MASVIASDITDEKKLDKLREFVKQKGEKAIIVEWAEESSCFERLVIHLQNTQSKYQIFFQKKIITANKVAKCKKISKSKGISCKSNKRCTTAKCPELEIGKNSATPCNKPKIIP